MNMFSDLSGKFQDIFRGLTGKNRLTEKNITQALHEVHTSLLSADVNIRVVKSLTDRIKKKALGKKVLRSVSPGQQFIKIVHDELQEFLGGQEPKLSLHSTPARIMVCGLQGSGKTTFVAKLGYYLTRHDRFEKPLLIACDLQRPMAIEQLKTLGSSKHLDVFSISGETDPVRVARQGLAHAKTQGHDVVIFDTAGRLHLDDELMHELEEMKTCVDPEELLFVANAMLGQDAVTTARAFHDKVSITGTVLTMLDGNTKGGAALSITEVTNRPLKFEGIGEKIEDLQKFHPQSMADRILGMGDAINLVRKAQEHFDEKEMESMEEKIKKASFTYADVLSQLKMLRKMGSLGSLLSMIPGMSSLNLGQVDEKRFFRLGAMIESMTPLERSGLVELKMSRKKRIARGSGTKLEEVNQLVTMYTQMKKLAKGGMNPKKLQKMMGGI